MAEPNRQPDPGRLRPVDVIRAINSVARREVLTEAKLRRHRQAAGYRLGKDHISLPAYLGWLIEQRHSPKRETLTYEDRREQENQRQGKQSQSARDIGPIPAIANPERREDCRLDLRRFLLTYLPNVFYWPVANMHEVAISRLQTAVLDGARSALAMPRGGGKSVLCRGAILWAISYAHRRYPVLIGAPGE